MWHGNNVHRMIVFGSERIGYLDNNVIQEWKLNETNRHDGVHREVAMDNIEEDIAQWPKEDVLNLSDSTWMDDTGSAEVTIGKKPDSVRFVDIATPSSVGYLSDNKLAFAHERSSHIAIYDHELRKTSGLVLVVMVLKLFSVQPSKPLERRILLLPVMRHVSKYLIFDLERLR